MTLTMTSNTSHARRYESVVRVIWPRTGIVIAMLAFCRLICFELYASSVVATNVFLIVLTLVVSDFTYFNFIRDISTAKRGLLYVKVGMLTTCPVTLRILVIIRELGPEAFNEIAIANSKQFSKGE